MHNTSHQPSLEAYFKMIVDQSNDYNFIKDCRSTFLATNRLHTAAGLSKEKFLGINDDATPWAEHAENIRMIDKLVLAKHTLSFIEPIRIYDGSRHFLITKKKPIKLGNADKTIIFGNSKFITSKKLISILDTLLTVDIDITATTALQPKQYFLKHNGEKYGFSKRETQCLFYMLRGLSANKISKILCLSKRTIETYFENIKNKMGCSTKSEVIGKSIDEGFLNYIPTDIFNINE